jgi:hypothetical protein
MKGDRTSQKKSEIPTIPVGDLAFPTTIFDAINN